VFLYIVALAKVCRGLRGLFDYSMTWMGIKPMGMLFSVFSLTSISTDSFTTDSTSVNLIGVNVVIGVRIIVAIVLVNLIIAIFKKRRKEIFVHCTNSFQSFDDIDRSF
jgi:hypothetical protein